jgi:hypothetical protein
MTRWVATRLERLSIAHLWPPSLLLALLWATMRSPLACLDFWWHLKVGEIIWKTRHIPQVDTFSFTAQGRCFVYQNWLSEIAYYLLYRMGGLPLLVFLHALTIVLALAVVLWSAWEATRRPRLVALCMLVIMIPVLRFRNARPQVFSMVLFALCYALLRRYRRRAGSHLWGLIPLMALWVNVHGAFVMGLGLVVVYAIMEIVAAPGGTASSSRHPSSTPPGVI